jgi:hypothetical protein
MVIILNADYAKFLKINLGGFMLISSEIRDILLSILTEVKELKANVALLNHRVICDAPAGDVQFEHSSLDEEATKRYSGLMERIRTLPVE